MTPAPFTGSGNPSQAGSPVTIVDDAIHNAFPGGCRLVNDDLLVAYRAGTDHAASEDGNLLTRVSTDDGATWSSATTVINNANDVRDVGCCRLANDLVMITFSEFDGATWAPYSMLSTDGTATAWDSPIAITTAFTDFGFVSAPAVEILNGDILVPLYGMDTGDTEESVRVSRSTDGGATWADDGLVVDGVSAGRDMQEPCIALLDNGDLVCMIRSDFGAVFHIFRSISTDDGATWGPVDPVFTGSGRPAVHQRVSDGALVCMYRTKPAGHCRFRTSWDRGRTWSSTDGDFTSGDTLSYTYGQWITMADDSTSCVYSTEFTTLNANVFFSALA